MSENTGFDMAASASTGQPYPLGAMAQEGGVNFALFSENAHAVELCLFDEFGQYETVRIPLQRRGHDIWCVFVENISVGCRYGYRVDGAYSPEKGHCFNANKLLIDPYARALDGIFYWDDRFYGYNTNSLQKDLEKSDLDSAAISLKSVVCERKTQAEIDAIQNRKPHIPWHETLIYEMHVKGFSQLNLDLPSADRATFSGLSKPSVIQYIQTLGVTAIELLPVHAFIDEAFLVRQGLTNYWGYNTLNFFTVHQGYLKSGDAAEFLECVERYHEAGLEVILDVVYNHTAESNELGPMLSYRGIDNSSYYRLESEKKRHYVNDTGCGNTLKVEHPRVMQMILDSLRYWAGEMGVDGFRFDLASILGRDSKGFSQRAAFFQAISQDPLLSRCKLIAEPWDIGPGGYQLGAYPGEWSEWNDQYRDVCRRFWRGEKEVMPEFARRIHGSSDIFEHAKRRPRASVNFISSHDGFTLADTVRYSKRHNEANKENNRDGHSANHSDNYGSEGPSDDPNIIEIRLRQQRNFIATLFLSQGVPMLLAGDELGRSQDGNNNAYCQDNDINWFDWRNLHDSNQGLLTFTQRVIALRKQFSLFKSDTFIHNPEDFENERRCARWVSPSGTAMTEHDWHHSKTSTLGWILHGASDSEDTLLESNSSQDVLLLILFNADAHEAPFVLPAEPDILAWWTLLNTESSTGEAKPEPCVPNSTINMAARSMQVLQARLQVTREAL